LSRPGSFLGQKFLWSLLPGIEPAFLDLPSLILAQNLSIAGKMLPTETSEMRKCLSALCVWQRKENAEEVLKSYQLLIVETYIKLLIGFEQMC
jgi:hypothetical protein